LLTSVVQWGFWEDAYRPDIVKELGVAKCSLILEWGRDITAALDLHEANLIEKSSGEEDANGILEAIGTTPIVSKEYDPNCIVSYTAGLIRMMKATGDKIHFSVIRCTECFIGDIDCVDKGVITEIIDYGFNFTNDCDSARLLSRTAAAVILSLSRKK